MLMNSQKLCEMSDSQFAELIMLIRYSALNASNLSSKVAMAFLTAMPSESRAEGVSTYDLVTEDDKRFMDYFDEDKPPEPITEDFIPDESSYKKGRITKFSTLKYRISKAFSFFKDRKRTQGTVSKDSNLESDRRSKKEKFNISYADLMVPSTFKYDPKVLEIPLHDFRKRSISISESVEIKIVPNEEVPETAEPKIHAFPFESNNLFRQKHPWLHPTLSFTKLCRIKYIFMCLPNMVHHLDPSTSAIAWTLFERLVLIGIVTKFNRKLFSSICFILAYKFNQDYESDVINEILVFLTREKNIDAKSIFYNEMKIFTLLDFSLKLKYSYIQTHIRHYIEFNKLSFYSLYDTNETSYTILESD